MSRALVESGPGGERDAECDLPDFEFDQRPEAEKLAELQKRGLMLPKRPALGLVTARIEPAAIPPVYDLHAAEQGNAATSLLPVAAHAAATPVSEASRATEKDEGFRRLASELQDALDKQRLEARAELAAIAKRIAEQDARCTAPAIEEKLQQIEFRRQQLVMSRGAELAERLEQERALQRDFDAFRQAHGLTREPQYPSSAMFSVGVLLILILIEAGLNGVLFAESSTHGLLGGWTEAVVLAIANVGLAFLVGFYALRGLNRRGLVSRICAGVLSAAGLAAVIGLNLFGAHYRDFRVEAAKAEPAPVIETAHRPREAVLTFPSPAETAPTPVRRDKALARVKKPPEPEPEPASIPQAEASHETPERAAIARVFAAPWDIKSFNGVFLLLIGLCAASLALADGYRFDDAVPGYGRRHRELMEARRRSKAALNRSMDQASGLAKGGFEAVEKEVNAFARQVQTLKALHEEYAGARQAWDDRLREAEFRRARSLEQYRMAHKLTGASLPHGAMWLPDGLPESLEKSLKAHEKTLKKLQQAITSEREKLFGLFGGVAGRFEEVFDEYGRVKLPSSPDAKAGGAA